MATLTLAGISAALNLVFQDPMADQFRRDVLLPNLLEVVPDKNDTITWPAKFDGRATAGARAEGHDTQDSDFSSHTRAKASLAVAEYFGYAKVSGLAQSVAAATGGAGGADLLEEEVRDAIDEMAAAISADLYAGSVAASPTEIEGLARAVAASGTYAGLAQGTYAAWASPVNTLAADALSVANLRAKLHRPFKDAAGVWPEFVICPGTLWDSVGALFDDQSRIMVDSVYTRAKGEVKLRGAGGFRAIMVDGIPHIEDRHATASTFYALHSKDVTLRQVPAAGSSMAPSAVQRALKDLTGVTLEVNDIATMLAKGDRRLQPTIEALGKTGDNLKVMVKVYLQLRLRRRSSAAKLTLT